jgi:ceramide glucosyltransferase
VIADALLRGWVVLYAAAAVTAILRAATRPLAPADAPATDGDEPGGVVLVRPLAGDERGLRERLSQTGGARLVLFAVGRPDDGAEPVAQHAAGELRARGINAVVVVTDARGPNHKAAQLARALAMPVARLARTVVVADSDVDLEPDAVHRLVSALRNADAAWAPPVEVGPTETWGDRASQAVLVASLHSFPLLGGIDPSGLVGKLFAVTREALDAAGGFDALVSHLGEDMELARRLRTARRRVTVAPQLARCMARGRPLGDVLSRYRRWLLVVRMQRPLLLVAYPLLLAPAPLLASILAASIAVHDSTLAFVSAAGLTLRVGVACAARALAGLRVAPLRALAQALFGDLVLLAAAASACASSQVTWRGRRLAFTADGTLREASRGEETHEEPLRQAPDEARPPLDHRGEVVRASAAVRARSGRERDVDPCELALDPLALADDACGDVALGAARERPAERDPELWMLRSREDVPETDGDDERALRHAGDLRRTRPELERSERRALAPLGKDPQRPAGGVEEARGVTDGTRAVGGVVEVDTERADATKEGYASEVRRIHHRVPVTPEQELGDVERDERIPPRRVVGDEEERRAGGGGARGLEPRDLDATEGALDARARVPSEPGIEPSALRGADHGLPS